MASSEIHHISCPYCHAGYGEVVAKRAGRSMEIEGFDTPRQCHLCGHHFMLKPKVLITGVTMEDYQNGR